MNIIFKRFKDSLRTTSLFVADIVGDNLTLKNKIFPITKVICHTSHIYVSQITPLQTYSLATVSRCIS